ncbi:hypothetical protein F751_3114 [Auxenochlorella protothecoides]|nr:hypothetical protein F751_3114 [Auxenochlorella protothecoides]KFM24396.1 hypothetical protein F751_3114 [Auxenochlorella protothecoides]
MRTYARAASLVLALAVAACLLQRVEAHGYLAVPLSRNALHNTDYCKQCLNAGGPSACSAGGSLEWPAGRHGMCGDPYTGERKHEYGGVSATGTITGTYTEGQVVNMTIVITAAHKGRFMFRVCVIQDPTSERAELTDECLNQHILMQADVAGAQNAGSPYWYDRGVGSWDMAYQLPQGLTCDGVNTRCVMQWWYLTGNSCEPPNTDPKYASPQLTKCGTNGAYPEEVRLGKLSPPPTKKSPSPSTKKSPPPAACAAKDATCGCSGGKTGLFADIAGGCEGFFNCGASGAYYMVCPATTLFNPATKNCDWPSAVTCKA